MARRKCHAPDGDRCREDSFRRESRYIFGDTDNSAERARVEMRVPAVIKRQFDGRIKRQTGVSPRSANANWICPTEVRVAEKSNYSCEFSFFKEVRKNVNIKL